MQKIDLYEMEATIHDFEFLALASKSKAIPKTYEYQLVSIYFFAISVAILNFYLHIQNQQLKKTTSIKFSKFNNFLRFYSSFNFNPSYILKICKFLFRILNQQF